MTLLTIFVGLIAFVNLVLLAAIVYLAVAVHNLLSRHIIPLAVEVRSAVKDVREFVSQAASSTNRILGMGESTAKKVSHKLIALSDLFEHSVSEPLIWISSFLEGVKEAVNTYRTSSGKEPEEE